MWTQQSSGLGFRTPWGSANSDGNQTGSQSECPTGEMEVMVKGGGERGGLAYLAAASSAVSP